MSKKKFLEKKKLKQDAVAEIPLLLEKARKAFPDAAAANRYIAKLRRLAMRYKIRLPRTIKRSFCSHCYAFLKPGSNCRIRTREGKIIYYCMSCKRFMRFPLSPRR